MKTSAIFFAGLVPSVLAQAAPYSGFTTYTELIEGDPNNNTWALTNKTLDRSNTLFVNVQIFPNGKTHPLIFGQFKELCTTFGKNKVNIIPRLRYGNSSAVVTPEPTNQTWIKNDVTAWTNTIKALLNANTCSIPLVQAGVLGAYGEWHDGPYCSVAGLQSSPTDRSIKLWIIRQLLTTSVNVATRAPQDYAMLKANLTNDERDRFTIHDDCIMAEGTSGDDTGTFVDKDGKSADYWRNYTRDEAGDNLFGGEPCQSFQAKPYNWSDWNTVCSAGSDGMVSYINKLHISYLNPYNPPPFYNLFASTNATWRACIGRIQNALFQYA